MENPEALRDGNFKNKKWFLITLAISIIFLVLAFKDVNLSEVQKSFWQLSYQYLLPSSISICVALYFRAIRWRYMLLSGKKISLRSSFSAIMIGYLANNIFPARFGELVRAFILRREEQIGASYSLATILVERLLDGLLITAFLLLSLMIIPTPDWIKNLSYLSSGLFALAVILMVISVFWKNGILRITERIIAKISTSLAKKSTKIISGFFDGMKSIRRRYVMPIVVLSILAWLFDAFGVYFALLSLNIKIPLIGSLFSTALIGVGMMIPTTPGALGSYEFFAVSALSLFGIEKSLAASFSILLHLIVYGLTTIIGFIMLLIHIAAFGKIVIKTEDDLSNQN